MNTLMTVCDMVVPKANVFESVKCCSYLSIIIYFYIFRSVLSA